MGMRWHGRDFALLRVCISLYGECEMDREPDDEYVLF